MAIHKTIPVQVWADVDEGIADMVRYLNTIEGVRTYASCQGTIGEGGAEPYRPQVLVGWSDESVKARLLNEFDFTPVGDNCGYVHPRGSIYLTHMLLCVFMALAVTGLISVVLARKVINIESSVGIPADNLGESGEMGIPKNVFVGDESPDNKDLAVSLFDGGNVTIRNKVNECDWHVVRHPCADQPSILDALFWKRKGESLWHGMRQDAPVGSHVYIAGWSVPTVEQSWPSLKFEVWQPLSSLLKDGDLRGKDSQIGAKNFSIPILYNSDNVPHCCCAFCSGIGGFSNFYHLFRKLSGAVFFLPQYGAESSTGEPHVSTSQYDIDRRKSNHPPFGLKPRTRVICGCLLFFCGFLLSLRCGEWLYRGNRNRCALYAGGAFLFVCSGLALILSAV